MSHLPQPFRFLWTLYKEQNRSKPVEWGDYYRLARVTDPNRGKTNADPR